MYFTESHLDSMIEIAFDVGEIRHNDQAIDIYEVEFELRSSQLSELIDFIQPWVSCVMLCKVWIHGANRNAVMPYYMMKRVCQFSISFP